MNFAVRERAGDEVNGKIIGIIGSFHPPACGYMIHSGQLEHEFEQRASTTLTHCQTTQDADMPQRHSKPSYSSTSSSIRQQARMVQVSIILRALWMHKTMSVNGSLRSVALPRLHIGSMPSTVL